MKEHILNLLKNRTTKETVDLSPFIKALLKNPTRESIREAKHELQQMVETGDIKIANNNHMLLDTVDTTPEYRADGTAAPTRYHGLDTVSIHAYGRASQVVVAPSQPQPQASRLVAMAHEEAKKTGFPYEKEEPKEAVFHGLPIKDAVMNGHDLDKPKEDVPEIAAHPIEAPAPEPMIVPEPKAFLPLTETPPVEEPVIEPAPEITLPTDEVPDEEKEPLTEGFHPDLSAEKEETK